MNRHLAAFRTCCLVFVSTLVGIGAGCSSTPTSTSSNDDSASGTFESLTSQLENCNSEALDCLKAADCDTTKDQACRDAYKTCHDNNVAVLEAFGKAVKACFDTERTCVQSSRGEAGAGGTPAPRAGTGGRESPRRACADDFKTCVNDDRPMAPAPGECTQALRTCVQDSSKKPRECFDDNRKCVMDRLPPCCARERAGAGGRPAGRAGAGGAAGRSE